MESENIASLLQEVLSLKEEQNFLIQQLAEVDARCADLAYQVEQTVEDLNECQTEIERLQCAELIARRNAQNINFLRNFGIGLLTIASFSSAWDWGGGISSFHGDRILSILQALCGCGGLAFLGFNIKGKLPS